MSEPDYSYPKKPVGLIENIVAAPPPMPPEPPSPPISAASVNSNADPIRLFKMR